MKIVKRIITVLITIVLLLILSFNLFNFISIKVLGNKLPTINGYALLEVVSGSMEPKFSIGDIVIIDTKVDTYKANDIITFEDVNGAFVTHRIIEITDEEIITKGDANNTVDSPIDRDSIVGKYTYKITGVGALIRSLRSPFVMMMVLVIGILLCIFISTDSKGNVILTEDEKRYMEFLDSKKKTVLESDNNNSKTKKVDSTKPKKTTAKKVETTKSKKAAAKKAETTKPKKITNKKVETTKPKKVATKKVENTKSKKVATKKVGTTKKTTTTRTKTTSSKKTKK